MAKQRLPGQLVIYINDRLLCCDAAMSARSSTIFRGMCRLHLQSSTVKTEGARSSEMSASSYQTTWRHIAKNNLVVYRGENVRLQNTSNWPLM
jgi:hypothetical protein